MATPTAISVPSPGSSSVAAPAVPNGHHHHHTWRFRYRRSASTEKSRTAQKRRPITMHSEELETLSPEQTPPQPVPRSKSISSSSPSIFRRTRKKGLSHAHPEASLGLVPSMPRKKSQQDGFKSNSLSISRTPSPSTFKTKVHHYRPQEIAEQLSIMDSEFLCKIKSQELVGGAWMKENKAEVSPNVLAMIRAGNRLAMLVPSEILAETTPQARAKVIALYIKVALCCYQLHNYNSLKAVLAGLLCTPVFRLKKSWREVPAKRKRKYDSLCALMTEEHNYASYRYDLQSNLDQDIPCIPFLGVLLTTICQTDSAHAVTPSVGGRRMSGVEGYTVMEAITVRNRLEMIRKISGSVRHSIYPGSKVPAPNNTTAQYRMYSHSTSHDPLSAINERRRRLRREGGPSEEVKLLRQDLDDDDESMRSSICSQDDPNTPSLRKRSNDILEPDQVRQSLPKHSASERPSRVTLSEIKLEFQSEPGCVNGDVFAEKGPSGERTVLTGALGERDGVSGGESPMNGARGESGGANRCEGDFRGASGRSSGEGEESNVAREQLILSEPAREENNSEHSSLRGDSKKLHTHFGDGIARTNQSPTDIDLVIDQSRSRRKGEKRRHTTCDERGAGQSDDPAHHSGSNLKPVQKSSSSSRYGKALSLDSAGCSPRVSASLPAVQVSNAGVNPSDVKPNQSEFSVVWVPKSDSSHPPSSPPPPAFMISQYSPPGSRRDKLSRRKTLPPGSLKFETPKLGRCTSEMAMQHPAPLQLSRSMECLLKALENPNISLFTRQLTRSSSDQNIPNHFSLSFSSDEGFDPNDLAVTPDPLTPDPSASPVESRRMDSLGASILEALAKRKVSSDSDFSSPEYRDSLDTLNLDLHQNRSSISSIAAEPPTRRRSRRRGSALLQIAQATADKSMHVPSLLQKYQVASLAACHVSGEKLVSMPELMELIRTSERNTEHQSYKLSHELEPQ